ncbi:exodeoxyribonuclease III [Actinoplanes sp. RD1]|uniref:exodeoxyribonuclease III n=1 Tax=Actinoplanes sp. RD1 TaxID=3064538 RepID=UPI0027427A8E|nr:exodeoxyribonuclease III [Actinoplanes sp. RD1]
MRFATWNVNSVKARLPRLLEWLEQSAPDVLCLQETKVAADGFPEAEVAALGYETAAYGQGRWNGVAILSKIGLTGVERGFPGEPGYPGPEARAVSATCGGIRFTSVYVPNGRTPEDPHYAYKLQWFSALRADLAERKGPAVVTGDFNVAPTDDDVWDPRLFVNSTHVTAPERAALADLLALGYVDVLPRPLKGDHPFTYWDYRAGMFHQNKGMRIDLVYATPDVAGAVTDALVDREARKGKGPSDHAPVVVDLAPGSTF